MSNDLQHICSPPSKPLVVDLDGTLIKTDLLFESASRFVSQHPFQVFRLLLWLFAGKSLLKAQLAEAVEIDVASLPYNQPLVAWLRAQKLQGQHIVLATASHRLQAELVAKHLGFFDAVWATEGDSNLKSEVKRNLLVSQYGDHGFDYVGNDDSDLPVWQSADCAHVVTSSPRLAAKVHALGNLTQAFESGKPTVITSLFKAMRPHQWMKNLLIFLPLFAAHQYGDEASLIQAALAFIVFGFTASSVYLLNDLVDVADDRHHPRKRNRPFASGDLSLAYGWLAWPTLLLFAFLIASYMLTVSFVAALATYFVLTVAYSLRLKQIPIVDVLSLACLYTLRIIAGTTAIGVPLSFWLLTFSMFMFLSLALIKRFSELKSARHSRHKGLIRGRGYVHEDLEMVSSMGTGAGYIAVLVLALYIQDKHTAELYLTPQFIWLSCPLVLYWISRAWLIAHRGQMHDDPIVFALRDRVSWLVGVFILCTFGLAKMVA